MSRDTSKAHAFCHETSFFYSACGCAVLDYREDWPSAKATDKRCASCARVVAALFKGKVRVNDLRKLLAEARAYVEGAVTERENDGLARRDLLARIDEALAGPKVKWKEEAWGAWACLPDGTRLESHLLTCRWEVWPASTKYESTPKINGDACDYTAAKRAAERAAGVSR